MKVVSVQSHYGELIFINQCQNCGGVWFDSDELYRINPNEADKVDMVDVNKIKAHKEITSEPLICPHDGQKLVVFHDINFPQNLIVESCPTCDGFWFNQGEFKEFEEYREEKIKKLTQGEQVSNSKLEEQINKLLNLESSENTYNTLGKIGKFLSSPVQRGSLNFGDATLTTSGTANLAGSVLGAVLRGMVSKI